MLKDMFGREIKLGDIIAWPGRSGSNVWMNVAVVRGFRNGNVLTKIAAQDYSDGYANPKYVQKSSHMYNVDESLILAHDTLTDVADNAMLKVLLEARQEILSEA